MDHRGDSDSIGMETFFASLVDRVDNITVNISCPRVQGFDITV